MQKKSSAFSFAFQKTLPILFSYFFTAVAFGIVMAQAGYGTLWSLLSSVIVYTGALQFVLADFLRSGSSLLTAALTALFMGSRHIFYGLPFLQDFRQMGKRGPYMILSLTDETYSLLVSLNCPADINRYDAMFDINLLSHCYWILGSAAGGLLSQALKIDFRGIDFCLTALFITILLDQAKTPAARPSIAIGLCCGIGFLLLLGASQFILPAFCASALILCLRQRNTAARKEIR